MTESEQTPAPAETTHVGKPVPEAKVDSSSAVVEQKNEPVADAETKEAETPEVAPVTWDGFKLNAPEGHDTESLSAFGEAAKEQGIAPTAAQKMLDKIVPVLQERQMASINAIHEEWIAASKADKEIGGEKFAENLAIAKKAAEAYGDADLQTLLKPISEGGQGLGNHPAINRMLFRVGKALQPSTNVVKGNAPTAPEDRAKRLYSASNMQ